MNAIDNNPLQLNLRSIKGNNCTFSIPNISPRTFELFEKKSCAGSFFCKVRKIFSLGKSLNLAKANESEEILFGLMRSILVTAVIAFTLFAAIHLSGVFAAGFAFGVTAYLFSLLVAAYYAYEAKDLKHSASILPFVCFFLAPLLPFLEAYDRVASIQDDLQERIGNLSSVLLYQQKQILEELEEIEDLFKNRELDTQAKEELCELLNIFRTEPEQSSNSSSSSFSERID